MLSSFDLLAMIDPALCKATAAGSWASLSWRVYHWLIHPTWVVPPLLVLIVLPWLIRPLRWKRSLSGLGVVLLVGYLTAASPTAIMVGNKALIGFLPPDPGTPADAIVVLGRGGELRPQRVQVAAQLWQKRRAPLVFASGYGDAQEIVQALEQQGLSASAVDGEPCSRTTEENARFTAALLQPRNIHRIVLVTDPPHMLRSFLTFQSLGFEVIPHTNPLPALARQQQGFLVFREYLGLVSYGLKGRFFPREVPPEPIAQLPTRS